MQVDSAAGSAFQVQVTHLGQEAVYRVTRHGDSVRDIRTIFCIKKTTNILSMLLLLTELAFLTITNSRQSIG